jgi:hypothetical protein
MMVEPELMGQPCGTAPDQLRDSARVSSNKLNSPQNLTPKKSKLGDC